MLTACFRLNNPLISDGEVSKVMSCSLDNAQVRVEYRNVPVFTCLNFYVGDRISQDEVLIKTNLPLKYFESLVEAMKSLGKRMDVPVT